MAGWGMPGNLHPAMARQRPCGTFSGIQCCQDDAPENHALYGCVPSPGASFFAHTGLKFAVCRVGTGDPRDWRAIPERFVMLCIACIDFLLIFTGEISQNALPEIVLIQTNRVYANESGRLTIISVKANSHRAIISACTADSSVLFVQ